MANGNTPSGWVEMRERHTEKLLLAGLFLVLVFMAWATDATWPENMANMVLGALIGIITGRATASRAMDPGNRATDKGTEKVSSQVTTVKTVEEGTDEKKP